VEHRFISQGKSRYDYLSIVPLVLGTSPSMQSDILIDTVLMWKARIWSLKNQRFFCFVNGGMYHSCDSQKQKEKWRNYFSKGKRVPTEQWDVPPSALCAGTQW